jgi:hypothetical protein
MNGRQVPTNPAPADAKSFLRRFRESSEVHRGAFSIGLAAVAGDGLGALMHIHAVSKLPCTAQGCGFYKFLNQYAAIGLDHPF